MDPVRRTHPMSLDLIYVHVDASPHTARAIWGVVIRYWFWLDSRRVWRVLLCFTVPLLTQIWIGPWSLWTPFPDQPDNFLLYFVFLLPWTFI
jgi:hypothetical protein